MGELKAGPGRAGLWLLIGLVAFGAALLWKSGRFDPLWFASPDLGAGPGRAGADPWTEPGPAGAWNPAPLIALVPALLPALPEQGRRPWPRTGTPESFAHARMADKINGAIVHFDRWGVRGLVAASFEDPAEPGRMVELSLYEMGSPADAFGVLQSFRPPGATCLSLGEWGWADRTSVAFCSGPVYGIAVGHRPGPEVEAASLALAGIAAGKAPRTAPGAGGMEARSLLPEEGRNPGSERYFRNDAFGGSHPFLEQVFTSDHGDPPVTLIACRPPDGARPALEAWRASLEEVSPAGELPPAEGSVLGQGPEGFEGGLVHGSFLLGVFGAQDRETCLVWLGLLRARAQETRGRGEGNGR